MHISSLFKHKRVLFFTPLLFIFTFSPLNAATTKFNNGFELVDLSGLPCSGNCLTVTTSSVFSGKYSANFALTQQRATDFYSEANLREGGLIVVI